MANSDEECPISLWRRTEFDDVSEIKKLVKVPQTALLFGDRDIEDLVEKSNLCLCQENSVGRIISCVCLCDYPNIPAVPPSVWLDWVRELYGLRLLTVRNTYFLHYLVWSPNYSNEFLKLLLHTIYINNYYLQYILLVVPPGAQTADIFEEYFTRILPINENESCNVQTILISMRQHHVPRLRIRKALEEDNDDIIPILARQNEDLRKLYGDFYIAEMIANPEKNRQMVVAEHKERAIGFMSMNTNIDFEMLNGHFEMAPFYGLRKPAKNDNVLSANMIRGDSLEGLKLPTVIGSEYDLSRLSFLSSALEEDISSSQLPPAMDVNRIALDRKVESDSMESIIFDESLTVFKSFDDFEEIEEEREEEEEEEELEGEDSEATVEPQESFYKYQSITIPSYFGRHNAFMIELYAMHEEWDERMSADFLEAAFECYTDLDYCILTLPPTCNNFPLLAHFVRVVPRPSRSFSQELYVCHRNSLLSHITVRDATHLDIPIVKTLIMLMKNKHEILIDFEAAIKYETSNLKAFVILSENDIVGVAVVMPQDEILHLQTHYDVEAYANLSLHTFDSHGILKHFSLSPIFSCHLRFFLSEILRLSDFTSLYYLHEQKTKRKNKTHDFSLVSALDSMIPVLPRRQLQYSLEALERNIPFPNVLRTGSPFALYYMNKRFSTLPKFCVNTRIVVVGSSYTGIAFLESLLFGQSSTYLTFNNITLVSPHGLPGEYDIDQHSKKLFVYNGYYSSAYMAKLNLRSYINIIYGKMTSIDKNEKYIVINHRYVLQYDYLMLFCGELFHLPPKYAFAEATKECIHGRRKSVDEPIKDVPQNVFLINTEIDGANSMIALKRFVFEKRHPPVIVYGSCLEAYACVTALQEYGLKGNKICFVEPIGREFPHISCFNDKEVDSAVLESLQNGNVIVLSGFYFVDWKISKSSQLITKVKFESKTKTINVECIAMFYYGNKCISKTTFLALERGQIVFDGALVIDHNFRTSDPYIYAAGTFTKYARRYYADKYRHRYYNSREIGERVAMKMLNMWDPTQETIEKTKQTLELFVKPLVKACILPGKMHYLKISKPGITVPLEAAMSQENYGIALVTGSCKLDSPINYFRLHLNSLNFVETIICYSKETIDVNSYIPLYGHHERMLNNLLNRFENGYISDFYEYFKQPWCYAVLLDRFNDFFKSLVRVFAQKKNASFSPLIDSIRLYFMRTNWKKISASKREEFEAQYKMDHEKNIQDLLIKYLTDNTNQLPMYANPEVLKKILHGYQNSPFFQPYHGDSEDVNG